MNEPPINKDGAANPAPKAPNPASSLRVCIEFASKKNVDVICPITKRRYRGAWSSSRMKGQLADERFATMPDMPGHQLTFEGAKALVVFSDPSGDPKFAEQLAQAQAICESMGWGARSPDKERRIPLTNADAVKTWLYWFRRWLDAGQVKIVRGRVPTMAEIEMLPGRVEYNLMDSNPRKDRFPAADERPAYQPPDWAKAGADSEDD